MNKKEYITPQIEVLKFTTTDLELFLEDVKKDNKNIFNTYGQNI